MTKRNFIALADDIRDHNERARHYRGYDAVSRTDSGITEFTEVQINTLADFCQSQNPRFNRERWIGYINGLREG